MTREPSEWNRILQKVVQFAAKILAVGKSFVADLYNALDYVSLCDECCWRKNDIRSSMADHHHNNFVAWKRELNDKGT